MRTSDICPTCTLYYNALCVLYNGELLPTLNIATLDSMEVSLQKIEAFATNIAALNFISDISYDSSWNGDLNAPTKNVVYEQIEIIKSNPITPPYTVATLPALVAVGSIAHVSDSADVITYRADVILGGGTQAALVFFDGVKWIYH